MRVIECFVVVVACSTQAILSHGQSEITPVPLSQGFASPPESAWPRTWWHWTRGAVTKDGITKDLEWMKRVGIAGFQLADVNFGSGQTVDPPVDFGSPEWLEALRHAAVEADRLDLEMAIFSSPGWSIAGGPWVKPHQAMKKLVWSETHIEGPQAFSGPLSHPPSNNGPFQDMGAGRGGDREFYRDVRVIAFPHPAAEGAGDDAQPEITTSQGDIQSEVLTDSRYDERLQIEPETRRGPAWIQYTYKEPMTVRAMTIAGDGGIPVGQVAASDDGRIFRTLVSLPSTQLYRQGWVRTFAIPTTTARYFRLEMTAAPLGPGPTMLEDKPRPARQYSLLEWKLHTGARIHRWQEKAGFGHLFEYETVASPVVDGDDLVTADEVVDLTSRLKDDGTLEWDVPAGEWTVLRLGYCLTGSKNRPAIPAATGYEVDKLSCEHTEAYYDDYVKPMIDKLGDLYGRSLRYFLIDSWEAGGQNWTDDMIEQFTRRRGYDPTPYLPALVGHVIESAETSDRFLWDFRRTLADMFAENFYAVMTERLHQDGLKAYSEASGVSLEIPEDTLLTKSKVDIPMGEFWMRDLHPRLMYLQDVRGAASAAHIYGKPIVGAESFTGGGYESPYSLKKASDYWLAQGINRIVFHTSAHQPLDTKPGNTMVGTHLHRNITWAELARPFNLYLARCCYLLQQGRPVVDIAYLLDEGAPSTMPIWGASTQPSPPPGYEYDFVNADVLLGRMTAATDGRLLLPDGLSYRLLVLPNSKSMRPELLEKLHDLVVNGGVTICGPRPRKSPSLGGQPAADLRVADLTQSLWGDLNGTTRTINYAGKGMVVWGRSIKEVLSRLGVEPDFQWAGPLDADVAWTHRRTDSADIYYVSNLTAQPFTIQSRFRVNTPNAQLWRPDTGEIEPIASSVDGNRVTTSFAMQQNETLFVVFNHTTAKDPPPGPQQFAELAQLTGDWEVTFPPDLGAPKRITISELQSWTEHETPGVRYFSGTATYSQILEAPDGWFRPGRRLVLDLGDVRDLAEVVVNDKSLGVLWKPPYRIDIQGAIRKGENHLQIRVTNQWTNRIVGDRNSAEEERVLTGIDVNSRFGPRELQASGLLGPVKILGSE